MSTARQRAAARWVHPSAGHWGGVLPPEPEHDVPTGCLSMLGTVLAFLGLVAAGWGLVALVAVGTYRLADWLL